LADQYEQLRDPEAWRKAHPEPERPIPEFDIPESEWDFLYDDEEEDDEVPALPARSLPRPALPVIAQSKPNRNDKVSVRYTDGTTVRDVKYKKVEADVEAGKCILI
jgi:preprotein translocase subunit SecA